MVDLESIERQLDWNFHAFGGISIDPQTGVIDVDGPVTFSVKNSHLPVRFGKVQSFDCRNKGLTTLEGAPQIVERNFWCNSNKLESLAGAPTKVGGGFYCAYNQLTSLKGAPSKVNGDFWCSNNKLESLEGSPISIGGSFDCSDNLCSDLNGMPQQVKIAHVSGNPLKNLVGLPTTLQILYATNIQFESLEGLESLGSITKISLDWQPGLGLLKLLAAKEIVLNPSEKYKKKKYEPVQTILNKYAGQGLAGSFACAHELELAGFKGNASW